MSRKRSRSFGIAIVFLLCACKKPEPVQQVAPTETGVIASPDSASASDAVSAPIASSEPSASAEPRHPTVDELASAHAPHTTQQDSFLRGRPVQLPTVRQGAFTVTGKLPPEVVRRIVRQRLQMFRACYEDGLAKKPDLRGRVTTKFTIGSDGSVSSVADGGSDLADPSVVQCVGKVFGAMTYPRPEAGTVSVVFPLLFNPSE